MIIKWSSNFCCPPPFWFTYLLHTRPEAYFDTFSY